MKSPTTVRGNAWMRGWLVAALMVPGSAILMVVPMAIAQERNAAIGQATVLAASAASGAGEVITDRLRRALASDLKDDPAGIVLGKMELAASGELLRPQPVQWPPVPAPLAFASREARAAWSSAMDSLTAREWSRAAAQFEELSGSLKPEEAGRESDRIRWLALGYAAIAELESGSVLSNCTNAWKELVFTQRSVVTDAGLSIGQCVALRWFELSRSGGVNPPPALAENPRVAGSELANGPGGALWDEIARHVASGTNSLSMTAARRFDEARTLRRIYRTMMTNSGVPVGESLRVRDGSKEYLLVRAGPESRVWNVYNEQGIRRIVHDAWSKFSGMNVLEMAWRLEGPGFKIQDGRIASARLSRFVRAVEGLPGTELHLDVGEQASSSLARASRFRQWWYGILGGLGSMLSIAGAWLTDRALRRHEELARRQSGFISSVTHELRAPVASVRLLAEGLESDKGLNESSRREAAQLIVRETRRLGGLIHNVLHMGRVERGQMKYEFEPTDLGQLVTETVELMRPVGLEWEVRIDWDRPEKVFECECDPTLIQQALTNLIDNALKHSPKGARVEVELEESNFGNSEISASTGRDPGWILRVRDSGPGIPESEMEKVFEPFYRVGNELRRDTSGIGLGLAIVRTAAEAHGGRVTARNRTAGGAEFEFRLPMRRKDGRMTNV